MSVPRYIIFFALLCNFAFCYEIQNAIADSLIYNNAIAAAKEQEKAASFSSRIAVGEFLPSVNVSVNADPTLEDLSYRYNGIDNKTSSPSFNLSVKQNLFKFGGSITKLRKGYYDYNTQKFTSQDKIQGIVLSVVDVYLDLLKTRQNVVLYKENIKALERALDSEKQKLKYGDSTRGDVAQAQSKLSTAKSEYVKAKSNEENQRATFLRLIGKDAKDLKYPKISSEKLPQNLDLAISMAQQNNSGLNAAYNAKKSLELAKASVITGILPSLDLVANLAYAATEVGGIIKERQEVARSFAVNLSVPLFQGGGEYMAILAATHNNVYGDQIYKDSYKALKEGVTIAWNNYKNSKSIIQAAVDSVRAYEIALDSVKKEEEMSLKTGNDVIDAEVDLLSARVMLIRAKNSQINALYKLFIMIYGNNAIEFFQKL